VLVAPAMNNHMYEHPATRANLQTLRERGVGVVEPGSGRLASKGEQGIGRMAEPPRLLAACEAALAGGGATTAPAHGDGRERRNGDGAGDGDRAGAASGAGWKDVNVLVTAGGTREPIDSVRFLGNSSSGRMGVALAEGAHARGARVTLVAANVSLPTSAGIVRREVVTAAELERACEAEFAACDVLLMAAAVADFRPAAPREGKIKKAGHASMSLELEATTDVLAALAAQRRDGQTLVGFAAEHGEQAVELARGKLIEKGLDALVVNDISREDIGFDSEANEVTILTNGASADGAHKVGRAAKTQIAEAILDAVEKLRAGR
jgi:phosphopantothenoylcysteine decarboxylase/phosphopantothenate--cysteine ligase